MVKKTLFIFGILTFLFVSTAQAVEYRDGCTAAGQCVNNKICQAVYDPVSGAYFISASGADCGSYELGKVRPPLGTYQYYINSDGTAAPTGIVNFASRLMQIFVTVCGVWTLFNFLVAGWTFIAHMENPKAQQEVKDKLTMTVIGLIIIATSLTLAGIFGLIFFKDANFILAPTLKSALDFAPASP